MTGPARTLPGTMADDPGVTAPKTRIVVGWDEESETVFVYQAEAGEAEGDPRRFEADVPAQLWEELMATRRAYDDLEGRVVHLAGVDPTMGRKAVCCREWHGDVTPGRRWFSVILSSSGGETEWPVRDLSVASEDTGDAAEARIAEMPEEFHLLCSSHPRLVPVLRDSLRVTEGGFGPVVSRCHRCGWPRYEHPGEETAGSASVGQGAGVREERARLSGGEARR